MGWRGYLAALSIMLGGCIGPGHHADTEATGPLAVRGSTETLEIAPVLLAARDFYPGAATVRNGGIGNLVGAPPVEGLGDGGAADVATHAETQALRYSLDHPEIRIILTVTEGRYRIVARRSAGIARLADLKGKRIATIATTSAGYFLSAMLAQTGIDDADVEIVRIRPIGEMPGALARHEVDAIAIWEPHAANAVEVLGEDAIQFWGDGVYRELFNLNTTAANLADPVKRRRIVAFVRAVIDASEAIKANPAAAKALVQATGGFPAADIERAWPALGFTASLPDDLLDVMTAEEEWLARQGKRVPRSRAVLAELIDGSVHQEARARARN